MRRNVESMPSPRWTLALTLLVAACGDDTAPADTESGSSSSTSDPSSTTSPGTGTTAPGDTSNTSTGDPGTTTGEASTSTTGTAESTGDTTEGSSSTGERAVPSLVMVAHGRTVTLLDVADGGLLEVGSAEVPGDGLLSGHMIFGAVASPEPGAVLVSSFNDCGTATPGCYGNARIDRFTYDANGIEHEGAAYLLDNAAFAADGIPCAEGFDADEGQEGDCAPTGMAFSPDGTRLYATDNGYRELLVFSPNEDGTLSYITAGADTGAHGLAVHRTEPYVYNGTFPIGVENDVLVEGSSGVAGNATAQLRGDASRMVSTIDNDTLVVFDSNTPAGPTELASLGMGGGAALFQDHVQTSGGYLVFVTGRDEVATVAFDGVSLDVLDQRIYGGLSARTLRGVTLVETDTGDTLAVAAYFRTTTQQTARAPAPLNLGAEAAPPNPVVGGETVYLGGGAQLYRLDPNTGAIQELEQLTFDEPSRVVLSLPLAAAREG